MYNILGSLKYRTITILFFLSPAGDVSMATVSSPLPPPVKNDWLPSGLDPHLSPPSPGGPRKTAPTQQVSALVPFHSKKGTLYKCVCVCSLQGSLGGGRNPPLPPATGRPAPAIPSRPGGGAPPLPGGRPGGALPPPLLPS